MGVTRLRLARFGSRNRPFYHVVATDSRNARDSKPIEQLGTYDPIPFSLDGAKEVRLKVDRVKYWLSVGAQPSERVAYLLWRGGLIASPPAIHFSPNAWKPKKKNAERALAAATKKAEKEKAASTSVASGEGETLKVAPPTTTTTEKTSSPSPTTKAAAVDKAATAGKATIGGGGGVTKKAYHTLSSVFCADEEIYRETKQLR